MGKNFGLRSDGTYDPNSNVLTLPKGAGYYCRVRLPGSPQKKTAVAAGKYPLRKI